jgi:hypothetical protein
VSTEPPFPRRQYRLYAAVLTTGVIAFLLLYGVGLSYHNPVLQGLSLTMPLAPLVWGMAFFHKEPRFPGRWRTGGATAVVLTGILADGLLSILAQTSHNSILVAVGTLVCVAPTFLFRIIERWKTAREKERQVTI